MNNIILCTIISFVIRIFKFTYYEALNYALSCCKLYAHGICATENIIDMYKKRERKRNCSKQRKDVLAKGDDDYGKNRASRRISMLVRGGVVAGAVGSWTAVWRVKGAKLS